MADEQVAPVKESSSVSTVAKASADKKAPEDKEKVEKVEKVENAPTAKISYYEAVGRRKESSARVRLYVVNEGSMTLGGVVMERGACSLTAGL